MAECGAPELMENGMQRRHCLSVNELQPFEPCGRDNSTVSNWEILRTLVPCLPCCQNPSFQSPSECGHIERLLMHGSWL
jgi:hypothetical protein